MVKSIPHGSIVNVYVHIKMRKIYPNTKNGNAENYQHSSVITVNECLNEKVLKPCTLKTGIQPNFIDSKKEKNNMKKKNETR